MSDEKEVTEKEIGAVIAALSNAFDDDLYSKNASELEQYWHFVWDDKSSLEVNAYHFHDLLKLYGSFCRRWEEKHNGSMCVVERVRDKYLMPKIRELVRQLTSRAADAATLLDAGKTVKS